VPREWCNAVRRPLKYIKIIVPLTHLEKQTSDSRLADIAQSPAARHRALVVVVVVVVVVVAVVIVVVAADGACASQRGGIPHRRYASRRDLYTAWPSHPAGETKVIKKR